MGTERFLETNKVERQAESDLSFIKQSEEDTKEMEKIKKIEEIIEEKIDMKKIENECKTLGMGGLELFSMSVVESLAELTLELKEHVSEYDTILSDDVSGRIPSLIFKKLIDEKRKEIQKPPVKTYFLASGRNRSRKINSLIGDFISKKKDELGKTLLVTDFIHSGRSITTLINILEKNQIDFDLAAVFIAEYPEYYNKQIQRHLYYGDIDQGGAYFYNQHPSVGVEKNTKILTPHPVIVDEEDKSRELVAGARKDIKIVADELSKLLD